ncbi:MAG: hypothetical protein ACXABO_01365 [Promethearchaeota archaeon]
MDEDQKFANIVNRYMEEFFKRNPSIAVNLGKTALNFFSKN